MIDPSHTAPAAEPSGSPGVPSGSPGGFDPRARELLLRAEGEAQAALALLFDVAAPHEDAGDHLREGWEALARLARLRRAAIEADEIEDPATELRTHAAGWLGPRAEAALQASAAPLADASGDPRATLTTHARGLVDAVRAAESELYGAEHRRQEMLAWRRRLGMIVLALVPVIVLLALFPPDYREGPWRAQYFENRTFEGEPHVRRDGDLRFKWEDSSPLYDLPEDGFSARWDTCLELDRAYEITFQLVSDDGARLFIDGELVVDNWGTHAERSRGGKAALEPGLHHVRVDYFEAKHDAMISLAASLRGERPDSLPTRLLHYPGDEIDDDDPCAAVRAALP
jgi:hypothetical protein